MVLYAVRDCARRMAQPLSLVNARRTALIVIGPDKSRAHADVWAIADVPVAAMDWISAGQVAQLQFGGITRMAQVEFIEPMISESRTLKVRFSLPNPDGALRPAVDRVFALDDIIEAHRYLANGTPAGKVVVTP